MNEKSLPLVSIFVMSYNGRDFLRDAIESFIAQTYKNIEICVSDDASTDGTAELLVEYKNKLGVQFKYNINETNLGITKNSNKCLELCSGKYIAYCGGDDLFLPTKIQKQIELLESKEDAIACYTDVEVFQSETKKKLFNWSDKFPSPKAATAKDVIEKGCFFCTCSVMVLNENLPKFNQTLPVASDWMQMVDYFVLNKKSLIYIDEVLSKYRRHANNVTRRRKEVSQAEQDTLNAYNIILAQYPGYFYSCIKGYAKFLYTLKGKLPTLGVLILVIRLKPINIKYYIRLFVYLITFGKL